MKMVIACLASIRLRLDTKTAFDSFTYELQCRGGVAHWLIEHQEQDPAIPFVKPQMVGGIRLYRFKCIGLGEDLTYVRNGFW